MSARLDGLTVDVAVRRREPVRVLDDVTLDLPAGAMTALVGESGCGKSMVAAALCGLLPPGSSVTGRVSLGDDDFLDDEVAGRDPRWRTLRGRRVGLVPQSAATSFTPVRTLGSQLDEVISGLGGTRDAVELCRAVHLDPDALRLYPHELSGGMAQRAAIAAAIAGDPAILVADEPTSALDPDLAAAIWGLLADTARRGAAVLVITHDVDTMVGGRRGVGGFDAVPRFARDRLSRQGAVPRFARDRLSRQGGADRVAVMRAGRIVEEGPAAEVLRSSEPYVAEFFEPVS
ncbi:ATP-binding cassette domain-containing protein [Gordonia amicalis]|uniref:ATP-binding cassette domain-containing protein n=2 Tax=Gordonia amicalis TaxID=89053 RepID=A0AAE4U8P9_9ACTN|nr:ATP-binding cassette domain-containing protein [Gordonia amicalis]MCZ4578515.1 ATP-binding cassette domain-containing protein [Gordonia amicalis]MCZ4653322.1 ATP-binding cassette domain-containing protein [Gordonia amicalis]MDV6309548.1 ATP-binding cassette domain-containing protein [Gordonia amicalis]MDV6312646.1 ATP-binding cassette domain-containing protein [Gordonia amicalis]MDV7078404.1 ATP-binding cassette domain-containing protein [Gordonia amicalis]